MAKNKENSIMPSDVNPLILSGKSTPSWAERCENSAKKVKNSDVHEMSNVQERFFIVKRQDGNFNQTSPFLINKCIQSVMGDPKSIKKLRSGDLLIEVSNEKQALQIKNCKTFANIDVIVSPHRTLNTCRGVISEFDLLHVTEQEITENLSSQGVTEARRIKIYRRDEEIPTNQKEIPTKHIILTFNSPNLPKSIKAGYLSCSVRPYIPNPLRCFRCQRFGHSKNSCRGNITCGRCSVVGHESENCNASPQCVNCKNNHPSYSKSCEQWIKEKEIQTIRTKENISYPEARKKFDSRTPKVGVSYSAALSRSTLKSVHSISTQTDSTFINSTEQTQKEKLKSQDVCLTSTATHPVSIALSNLTSMSTQYSSQKPNQSLPKSSSVSTKPKELIFSNPPLQKRSSEKPTKIQSLKQNHRQDKSNQHKFPNIKSSALETPKNKNIKYKPTPKKMTDKKVKNKAQPGADEVELEIDPDPFLILSEDEGGSMNCSSENLT